MFRARYMGPYSKRSPRMDCTIAAAITSRGWRKVLDTEYLLADLRLLTKGLGISTASARRNVHSPCIFDVEALVFGKPQPQTMGAEAVGAKKGLLHVKQS